MWVLLTRAKCNLISNISSGKNLPLEEIILFNSNAPSASTTISSLCLSNLSTSNSVIKNTNGVLLSVIKIAAKSDRPKSLFELPENKWFNSQTGLKSENASENIFDHIWHLTWFSEGLLPIPRHGVGLYCMIDVIAERTIGTSNP